MFCMLSLGIVPDPSSLLAALLVSSIGFALILYGRKMARFPHLVAGFVLLVFPYFVSGALWVLLIAAAILALVWAAVRNGW